MRQMMSTFLLTFLSVQSALAAPPVQRPDPQQTPQVSAEHQLSAAEKATLWGLTTQEWQKYETLLQGDAKFQFSQLEPVWVLGIYAESEVERRRYVKLFIEQGEARLNRALAFNQTFRETALEHFRHQPLIDLDQFYAMYGQERPQRSPVNLPVLGDTLVFFVDPKTHSSLAEFQRIKDLMLSSPGVPLEIYFMGGATESDIQAWARLANLDQQQVQHGVISLNQEESAASLFQVSKAPAGFVVRGENATPIEF